MPRAHVLVVDDEPNAPGALRTILNEEGFDVSEAADGVEALTMLREQKVDLTLADIRMPRLDGLALVRQLRARVRERFRIESIIGDSAALQSIFAVVWQTRARASARDAKRTSGLLRYDWPGNVRELENVIERAVVLATTTDLTTDDLPPVLSGPLPVSARPGSLIPGVTMHELEREAILRTLEVVDGSTSRAAEMLGIGPRTIQYRLKEYGQENGSSAKATEPRDENS